MRTILFLAVIITTLTIGFKFSEEPQQATTTVQQGDANIGFEWAFGALIGKDRNFVPITRDTTLKSGEEIKMMVKITKECYVYVIYYGSSGEIDMMFPYDVRQFQKDYVTDKNYYIPRGRDWRSLDKNTGKEVFFIVASTERLLDLEAKVSNYLAGDNSKKQSLAEEVVSEVRSVRKRYSTFATIAEKPVTIGGNIRGTEKAEGSRRPDVSNIATRITANNFFSKTITIDHQ